MINDVCWRRWRRIYSVQMIDPCLCLVWTNCTVLMDSGPDSGLSTWPTLQPLKPSRQPPTRSEAASPTQLPTLLTLPKKQNTVPLPSGHGTGTASTSSITRRWIHEASAVETSFDFITAATQEIAPLIKIEDGRCGQPPSKAAKRTERLPKFSCSETERESITPQMKRTLQKAAPACLSGSRRCALWRGSSLLHGLPLFSPHKHGDKST